MSKRPGYILGDHWLETAFDRICAGDQEQAVMADYGWTQAERKLGDPEIAVEILRLRVAELEQAISRATPHRRGAGGDSTVAALGGRQAMQPTAGRCGHGSLYRLRGVWAAGRWRVSDNMELLLSLAESGWADSMTMGTDETDDGSPTAVASDVLRWAAGEIERLRLTDAEREAVDPLLCDIKWQETIRLDFEYWMTRRVNNSNNDTLLKKSSTSGKYENFFCQLAWEAYRLGAREERDRIRHSRRAS